MYCPQTPNPQRSRPWVWFAPLLFSLLTGLVVGSTAHADDAPTATSVQVATLGSLRIAQEQRAAAQVIARNEAPLSAELAAVVSALAVDVGDRVERGALMLTLDARDTHLALRQARAQADVAKAKVELAAVRRDRAARLQAEKFVSADEFKALDTELKIAKAELSFAQTQVARAEREREKTELRAPYPLVVRKRLAQVGQMAMTGQPMFDVVEDGAASVEAQIDVARLDAFRAAIGFQFEQEGKRFDLRLRQVSSVLERAQRTATVRLEFVGDPAMPGSEGRLYWQLLQGTMPPNLLVRRGAQLGVFAVVSGRARYVPVKDAAEGRSFALDLPDDTLLVTEGQQSLQDGQSVSVREGASGSADS